MKNAIASFFNKPILVVVTSLIIAGGIGTYSYAHINAAPQDAYVPVDNASTSAFALSNDGHLTLAFLTGGKIVDVNVKVGDTVKKGEVLAALDPESTQGAVTQAQAAYDSANANYHKVINGATGPTIDASKTAVATAETNLDQISKQQDLLVANAFKNLLNSTPEAVSQDPDNANDNPPTITGSYTLGQEGDIIVETYGSQSSSGLSIHVSGLVTDNEPVTSLVPTPLGNSGLSIQFADDAHANETWIISIPNKKAANYVANSNAYQSALQARTQLVAAAQSALDQANSNLAVVAAAARPEDVAAAKAQVDSALGALQIAQAAFDNRRITSPGDGTVSAVHIAPGEVATPDVSAIELSNVVIQ